MEHPINRTEDREKQYTLDIAKGMISHDYVLSYCPYCKGSRSLFKNMHILCNYESTTAFKCVNCSNKEHSYILYLNNSTYIYHPEYTGKLDDVVKLLEYKGVIKEPYTIHHCIECEEETVFQNLNIIDEKCETTEFECMKCKSYIGHIMHREYNFNPSYSGSQIELLQRYLDNRNDAKNIFHDLVHYLSRYPDFTTLYRTITIPLQQKRTAMIIHIAQFNEHFETMISHDYEQQHSHVSDIKLHPNIQMALAEYIIVGGTHTLLVEAYKKNKKT